MTYRFKGLPLSEFQPLFSLSDEDLSALGVRRMVADEMPGFPCRVTLEDAQPGERVLLLSFTHQTGSSPYRASGPIFVREAANGTFESSQLPPVLCVGRLLSARAYDAADMMIDADVVESSDVRPLMDEYFAKPETRYVHLHYARRGCFAAKVERA